MISFRQIHRFILKTPEQRRRTIAFKSTIWLSKLPYAPHRVHLSVPPGERVSFWWSYFPCDMAPGAASIFSYWGGDVGDLRLLWKLLQPGMTFFDVGAYHGIYAVIAGKRLGPSGRLIAFEPSPDSQRRLRLHLHLNRISSAAVEACAVAGEEGTASFFTVRDGHPDMNSLRQAATGDPVNQILVQTTTLDGYLNRKHIEKVDLVKIDTEGAEIEVFRGADRFLSQVRPLVICEVLDMVTRPWGYPASDIIARLESYDYQWFDILQDGNLLPHQVRREYPEIRNYLAVPREKQDRLRGMYNSGGRMRVS